MFSLNRKCQITAFMLVGIVLLAIFGFTYYATSAIREQRFESQVDVLAEKITETNILKQYVTLCLKNSLEDSLITAGMQGGYIQPPLNHVIYQGFKTNYGITPIEFSENIPGPPAYPCVNSPETSSYPCAPTPYNWITTPARLFSFGNKNLPFLCSPEGPNAADLALFPYPCPIGTYGPDSLQEQLNDYIETKIEECVNLEPLMEITDMGITSGTPNVTVMFAEDEVIAQCSYPLNISVGALSSTRLFDFQVNLPVRLKKIYGLADFIAKKEVQDIKFNATRDFRQYKYFGKEIIPPVNVTRYNVQPKTDIIEINDSVSVIEGKPYTFRFAVWNRFPALDPIPKPRPAPDAFDIVVVEGTNIEITPKAYDPDDNDQLTITIRGWKADKDARFNPQRCFSDLGNCQSDPYWAVDTTSNAPDGWDGLQATGTAEYTTATKSTDYVTDPLGCAPGDPGCTQYSRDLGAHNVTVEVCDNNGDCDYQVVKILVTDVPYPSAKASNYYTGAWSTTTSTEDPFVLDSSGSCVYCAYSSYRWIASDSSGSGFSVRVPEDIADDDFNGRITIPGDMDIRTIKGSPDIFHSTGLNNLVLEIAGLASSPLGIDVKNCLDFDHSIGVDHAPYPYNDNTAFSNPLYQDDPETISNPFMADHSCCSGNDYISRDDTGSPCYVYRSYGGYTSFDMNKFNTPDLSYSVLSGSIDERNPMSTEKKNDIFRRTFERLCSGDRGNICSGDVISNIELYKQCSDFDDNDIIQSEKDKGVTQTERCSGVNPLWKTQESPGILNDCSVFPTGKTFESEWGSGSGKCSVTPACSSGQGDDTFGTGGPFKCSYALCDGNSYDMTGKHCDYGMDCSCDISCGADPACSGFTYDQIENDDPDTYRFDSAGSGTRIHCGPDCQPIDPDLDGNTCVWVVHGFRPGQGTAAHRKNYRGFNPFSLEVSTMGNCCGDDTGETYIEGSDGNAACCNSNSDCVYAGACISSGQNAGPLNTKQQGVCASSMKRCQNKAFFEDYSGVPDYEQIETSCDRKDNDCDGEVDEGCA